MNESVFENPDKSTLAIEKVWKQYADLVDRFQLSHESQGVIETEHFVMVRCGDPEVSAYELSNALRELEFAIERESGLDITLMLEVGPDELTNGSLSEGA